MTGNLQHVLIAGTSAGRIRLGAPWLSVDPFIRNRARYWDAIDVEGYATPEISFRVIKSTQCIAQITVSAGFPASFPDGIAVGSLFSEVCDRFGKPKEENFVYFFRDVPFTCFELTDIEEKDNWDEMCTRVAHISVYSPGYSTPALNRSEWKTWFDSLPEWRRLSTY